MLCWVCLGPKANNLDVFAARLPGPPSCLTSSKTGFWVHISRVPAQQAPATLWGGLLSTFSTTPVQSTVKNNHSRTSIVLQFNEHGSCVQNLQDSGDDGQLVRAIRSMQEYEGRLFLCLESGIAIYDLAGQEQQQRQRQAQKQSQSHATHSAMADKMNKVVHTTQTKQRPGGRTLHPV